MDGTLIHIGIIMILTIMEQASTWVITGGGQVFGLLDGAGVTDITVMDMVVTAMDMDMVTATVTVVATVTAVVTAAGATTMTGTQVTTITTVMIIIVITDTEDPEGRVQEQEVAHSLTNIKMPLAQEV